MDGAARPPMPQLDSEWSRISCLLLLAEARRTGERLDDDFAARFRADSDLVTRQRAAGVWAAALPAGAAALTPLGFDLLALALTPDAMPAFAPRLQSLQAPVGGPQPSLALLQELLMLETGSEVAALYEHLSPHGQLCGLGLVGIEGEGPYQTIRPGPGIAAAVLGRSPELGPPHGSRLVARRAAWDELILPAATLEVLKEFVTWVVSRPVVFGDWGARHLAGPLALFSGPTGSGKSFSAAAITAALGQATGEPWALYALDLGRIMSKYVGETEKNLNRLLEQLHGRRAVLQIDEADGLLGRRGEISDARDRYSNLEVSHMLSRFEAHDGPVILTTNLRGNIDSAFLRRFQLVVDFPQPGAEARGRLWAQLLPPRAPRANGMVPEALGGAVALAGGAIHNAAVYAATLAAGAGDPISYRHIARAVWRELNKDGRPVRLSELGFLAQHLEDAA